jgi:SAM-dependent methyltransferase
VNKSELSVTIKVGLFFISASTLLFEINLSRIFSITQFYHFAFLIVSLALFGYGASGTFLSIFPRFGRRNPQNSLAWMGLGISVSIMGSYILTNLIPFDSFSIAWDRKQIGYLILQFVSLSIPFYFNGLAIGIFLDIYSEKANQVYAINMVGSSLGCIGALVVPSYLGGEGTVTLSAFLALIALLCTQISRIKPNLQVMLIIIPSLFLMIWLGSDLMARITGENPNNILELNISPYKSISYALQYPEAEIISQKWNSISRVDIIESLGIRSLPGVSYQYTDPPPPEHGLFIDGDNLSPIVLQGSDLTFTNFLPFAVAYQLRPEGQTLVLSPKGGLDAIVALNEGKGHVTVVEDNDLVVSAASHIYENDRIDVVVEGERSYLRRSKDSFDVIVLSLNESYHPVRSGAYSLGENYRYTIEGVEDALSRLEPNGILVFSRWLQVPPSEWLRSYIVTVEALDRMELYPGEHLVAFRTFNIGVLVVKASPFNEAEIDLIKQFARGRAFDIVFAPGIGIKEVNQFSILNEPLYFNAFQGYLSADSREEWLAEYPFEVSPPTDDRPFFNHFFKWSQFENIAIEFGKVWQPFGGAGFFVILVLFIMSLFLAVVVILVPLFVSRFFDREGNSFRSIPRSAKLAAFLYFGCIGLGYLMIEIPLIQKFILYLGNPAYSFATVLFSILLFSGIGSQNSHKISYEKAIIFLVGVTFVTLLVLPMIFKYTIGFSLIARIILSVVIIAPMGFFMGIPFPKGIEMIGNHELNLIPWVWGINGASSVVASILAVLMALSVGFIWVFVLGIAAYSGAFFSQRGLELI